MRRLSRLAASALLLALAAPGFAVEPSAVEPSATEATEPAAKGDAAAALHRYLSRFQSIRANFVQRGPGLNGETSQGELWLSKPKAFRVVTGPPVSQTIVSDGTSLWTYDRDLEQVVISGLDRDAGEIPILLLAAGADEINALFRVDMRSEGARSVFSLTPRDADTIVRRFSLVIAERKPAGISIETSAGESGHIELSEVEFEPEMADGTFRFEPPDDVDVIDDRAG